MQSKVRLMVAAAALSCAGFVVGAQAQDKPLQVQDANLEGVKAELTEVSRREGVVTVKIRYRNTGSARVTLKLIGSPPDVDKYYLIAGSTKMLPLRDSQKVPVMTPMSIHGELQPDLKANASFLFWAKYPAPPATVKKVSIYTPLSPPFDEVPISEAQ